MTMTVSSLNPVLKEHYGPQALKILGYKDRPALALLPKYERFTGRNLPLPVAYSRPQNLAAGFNEANRSAAGAPAKSTTATARFLLERRKGYGNAFLDREAILAAAWAGFQK